MNFPTETDSILSKIPLSDSLLFKSFDYLSNSYSYLSPYLSRGVLSTDKILSLLLDLKGVHINTIETIIRQLAKRDFLQQKWYFKGDTIEMDLKKQEGINNYKISAGITYGETNIGIIDKAIEAFYTHGYLDHFMRKCIAYISCNYSKSHWLVPAKWMYFHLLDADWATTVLNWKAALNQQDTINFSINQETINTFYNVHEVNTFMDSNIADRYKYEIPDELINTFIPKLETCLPLFEPISINQKLPTYIYNFYNVDPFWRENHKANRILLLEPSIFKKYPVSEKNINFCLSLSKNIDNIQVFVGEFEELATLIHHNTVYYKEHPFNTNYYGTEIRRKTMFNIPEYHETFESYWKACKKELQKKL